MQTVTPETVAGDFSDTSIVVGSETFTFRRHEQSFEVEVQETGHSSERLAVRYTFGVWPLQQYLVDVGHGRLQALQVAWDTRPAPQGGQRWFYLGGDTIDPPGDPLHWRGLAYNWNRSCADCHSTNVDKGYNPSTRGYETTFAETSVGCESCHGPASVHVERAKTGTAGGDHDLLRAIEKPPTRQWVFVPGKPIAVLEGASVIDPELSTCAPCHARRAQLKPHEGNFDDDYRLALLEDDLYFADGQSKDEVFIHGSFLQSKMYASGVVCSDCHEPHAATLKVRPNALCSGCHRPEVFDTPSHTFHPYGSAGAECPSCHMPQRTYMGVDERADHRFGVPQPLLSAKIGAPDPCLGCHRDWTPQHAHELIERHIGTRARTGFAEALWATRQGHIEGPKQLAAIAQSEDFPPIVRATALVELSANTSPHVIELARSLAAAADPLLRRASATIAHSLPPLDRDRIGRRLLRDPVASVRLEAASAFIDAPPMQEWPASDMQNLATAVAEYRDSKTWVSDGPDGLVDLANLALAMGDGQACQTYLEQAIAIDPSFSPAHLNLADYYRAMGQDDRAVVVLENALSRARDPAMIHHALGLAFTRLGRRDEAIRELARAFQLLPAVPRLGYVYAVALFDTGKREAALEVLRAVHERFPGDRTVLNVAIQYARELGHDHEAQGYVLALQALERNN